MAEKKQNQGGGQRKCPTCPGNGRTGDQQNFVIQGRNRCIECEPEIKLDATGVAGKDDFNIMVTTTRNGVGYQCPFVYKVEGSDGTWNQEQSDAVGSKEISVKLKDKSQKVVLKLHQSSQPAVELNVPKRKYGVDISESAQEFHIEARVGGGGSAPIVVLVTTTANGHALSAQFAYVLDDDRPQFSITSKGTTSEPKGTKLVTFQASYKSRKVKFFCVEGHSNEVELILQPKPDTFREGEVSQGAEYRLTAEIAKSGDAFHEVLIQTYADGRQQGCLIAHQIEGESYKFDHTSDGVSDSEPRGTKVLKIPTKDKACQLRVHIIGAEVDLRTLELPVTRMKFKPKEAKPGKGFWQNLLGE